MFIFKYWTILFLLVIFSFNCSLKKEEDDSDFSEISITKEKHDFHLDFKPNLALLFENYLLVIGENLLYSNNIAAINLQTNKIDSVFFTKIDKRGLSNYLMKNDTLIAYNKSEDKWQFWDDEWKNYNINYISFFNKIVNGRIWYPYYFLYEDNEYFVTSMDYGEFGGCSNFQNKQTQKNKVIKIPSPDLVFKANEKYYLTGNLFHGSGFTQIIEVKDPEKIIELPDSLNFLFPDSLKAYWEYIDSIEIDLLPDTFKFTKRSYDFYINFNEFYPHIKKEKEKHYLISYLLDTNGVFGVPYFDIHNNLLLFYQDTCFNFGIVKDKKIFFLENLYKEELFTYNSKSQFYNNKLLVSFVYWQRKSKEQNMTCLIYKDRLLRRFDFY